MTTHPRVCDPASGFAISLVVSLCLMLGAARCARAEDAPSYKFTTGVYRLEDIGTAYDVNLRQSASWGNTWVGYFHSSDLDTRQWRAGWDRSLGDDVRLLPSVQVASGGFVGGSVGVETGETWIVGAGLGRTNLRNYFNLNFDPNDAISVWLGHRFEGGSQLTASLVADNRNNPDQRHVHLVYRLPLPEKQRLTLDLLFKRGQVDGEVIKKIGASVGYDWPSVFVKVAYDPKSNFTRPHMVRLSFGTRF